MNFRFIEYLSLIDRFTVAIKYCEIKFTVQRHLWSISHTIYYGINDN